MTEHDIQDKLRLELSKRGYMVIRINVIGSYTKDGRYVPPSVPVGFSDLMAFGQDGDTVFIEVKKPKGKLSVEQGKFIETMKSRGFKAGVCRDIDDLDKLLGGL
jgi:hypothetical protein